MYAVWVLSGLGALVSFRRSFSSRELQGIQSLEKFHRGNQFLRTYIGTDKSRSNSFITLMIFKIRHCI
jgi:hypothetical protein